MNNVKNNENNDNNEMIMIKWNDELNKMKMKK